LPSLYVISLILQYKNSYAECRNLRIKQTF
jgi:hypothetical protein